MEPRRFLLTDSGPPFPIAHPEGGYFCVLPGEIQMLILSFLRASDLGKCAAVCKEWNKLCKDECLWQMLVQRDFADSIKPDHKSWRWVYQCHHVSNLPKCNKKLCKAFYELTIIFVYV